MQGDAVLVAALAMFAIEFVADKVPWLDSAWDAVHTVVRPGDRGGARAWTSPRRTGWRASRRCWPAAAPGRIALGQPRREGGRAAGGEHLARAVHEHRREPDRGSAGGRRGVAGARAPGRGGGARGPAAGGRPGPGAGGGLAHPARTELPGGPEALRRRRWTLAVGCRAVWAAVWFGRGPPAGIEGVCHVAGLLRFVTRAVGHRYVGIGWRRMKRSDASLRGTFRTFHFGAGGSFAIGAVDRYLFVTLAALRRVLDAWVEARRRRTCVSVRTVPSGARAPGAERRLAIVTRRGRREDADRGARRLARARGGRGRPDGHRARAGQRRGRDRPRDEGARLPQGQGAAAGGAPAGRPRGRARRGRPPRRCPTGTRRRSRTPGIATVGSPEPRPRRTCPRRARRWRSRFEVGVRPTAKLGDYKGVEVGRREPEVAEEDVEAELERAARVARLARDRRARGRRAATSW